jgi:hypothetical protein
MSDTPPFETRVRGPKIELTISVARDATTVCQVAAVRVQPNLGLPLA